MVTMLNIFFFFDAEHFKELSTHHFCNKKKAIKRGLIRLASELLV